MSFKTAVINTPQYSTTDNGAKTHATSGDEVLNFFFLAGASRGGSVNGPLDAAIGADLDKAIRVLLWMRDCRGGSGERQVFRDTLKHLWSKGHYELVRSIIPLIPIVGRWDDLLVLPMEEVRDFIHTAIKNNNQLCAKWMPRQPSKELEGLRGDFTPKQWRKLLVNNSNTVEQLMCSGRWNEIEFKKVPSLAAARYQNAFRAHCSHYEAYKKALVAGEEKVHADVIFPHDVVKAYTNGDKVVSQAQWEALPNYIPEGRRILPISDVSGSMTTAKGTICPMDVSIALGLYIAEKQEGPFKDLVCTFSATSDIYHVKGDLGAKLQIIRGMKWGMNTNLQAAFEKILDIGLANKLTNEQMPDTLLILSDMEFDAASRGETNFKAIKDKYKDYNFELPKIVFWNLNGRAGNVPVRMHKTGSCLVSGFSPAILKAVLSGEDMNPTAIMEKTIMVDRYKWN